jgi:hypothetical protein
MKGFRIFATYYSLITITVLLVGSLFFFPKPHSLIMAALLTPLAAFFWLKASGPGETNPAKWSARFVTIVFMLSVLGIFAFSLTRLVPNNLDQKVNQTLGESDEEVMSQFEQINTRLDELKEEVFAVRATQEGLNKILGTKAASEELTDYNFDSLFKRNEIATPESLLE